MISVSQALLHIDKHSFAGNAVTKRVQKTMGMVLAADVLSPIHMPPFRQSAMDGYAIAHGTSQTFKVIGEVQAGNTENIALKPGEAIRIFTGARVPDAVDTVVMQEHVTREGDSITVDKMPNKDANVRPLGEQIATGDTALEKGTLLNEASIAFLVGLGIDKVAVYKAPKVSVLVTGNELQQPGKELKEGQVYESNSVALKLALNRIGIKKVKISRVEDDLKSTTRAVEKCLKNSDLVLISGGISVGDYDFVKQALENNEVEEIFYKVNQRPGKPLWFGQKGKTKVYALPGNPASSLSCFYLYVLPLVKAKMGIANPHLARLKATASEAIHNPTGKTLFLKGNVEDSQASLLTGQASSMLKSFAVSNALLLVPEDKEIIQKGEELTYIAL